MTLLLDRTDSQTTFTSKQAAQLTGITYRQLDYWTRQGYITPIVEADGPGSRRRWSLEQVERLCIVGDAVSNLDVMLSLPGGGGPWVFDLLREIEAEPDAPCWKMTAGNIQVQVAR